jgi:hypothetical protein
MHWDYPFPFLVAAALFSLYRMSNVPSFFVGPAGLADSLFALYRMSGVPSLFVGPADFDDLAGSDFLVWAVPANVKRQKAKRKTKIFFMAIEFVLPNILIFF